MARATPALATSWSIDHKISELKGTVTIYLSSKTLGPGPMTGASERYTYKSSVTGLTSSNQSVLTAQTYTDTYSGGKKSVVLNATKPGKSTVRYRYGGKKRTAKVVVKRYVNPVKAFSIGGKNYKSEFASSQYSWFDQGFLGKTVKVKAASGWRVKALYVYTWDSTNRNGSLKKIKNGAKIPKQNVLDVTAVMQNKKSKGTICLSFGTM